MPWLDLLGLNVIAGATVLGVPVKQMVTTENVAGEVNSCQSQTVARNANTEKNGKFKMEFTPLQHIAHQTVRA